MVIKTTQYFIYIENKPVVTSGEREGERGTLEEWD